MKPMGKYSHFMLRRSSYKSMYADKGLKHFFLFLKENPDKYPIDSSILRLVFHDYFFWIQEQLAQGYLVRIPGFGDFGFKYYKGSNKFGPSFFPKQTFRKRVKESIKKPEDIKITERFNLPRYVAEYRKLVPKKKPPTKNKENAIS